jgi:ubiquinone/menaquinone biosynthesis C-methylase UbiE
MVEIVKPQPVWRVLDIATGTGHTAFVFSPFVAQVLATDITPEMLETTRQQARERKLSNITVEYADAEDLPYADESFDLVTCRIAAHHFSNVIGFLAQARRVLHHGGIIAVVDNIVPAGLVGSYVNAFEKLRDPSHHQCLSLPDWLEALEQTGFSIQTHERLEKRMNFHNWASRHGPVMQEYLRALLELAPEDAKAFLQPQMDDGEFTFRLVEGLLVGQK